MSRSVVTVAVVVVALVAIAAWSLRAAPVPAPATVVAPAPQPTALPAAVPVAAEDGSGGLAGTIRRLLAQTVVQEAHKDATCWTTVRMMDAHFAARPIADDIAALKIEACKTLVCQLWRRASLRSPERSFLRDADIAAAMPAELLHRAERLGKDASLASFSTEAVMERDYHRITENRRYLISICEEASQHLGLFAHHPVDILPLSSAAAEDLAGYATVVTTSFLGACGDAAKRHAHAQVLPGDMKEAFAATAVLIGGPDATPQADAGGGTISAQELLDDTRALIDDKIVALRTWNAPIWRGQDRRAEEHQRELINRFCSHAQFSPEGFTELKRRLAFYAEYLAWGVEPMQLNTFAAGPNHHHPDLVDGLVFGRPRREFIDLTWGLNVVADLFPRTIATNGDVTYTLQASPCQFNRGIGDRQVRLLDYELDAVRDTTLHWSVMRDVWQSPQARPADPFVLEILADRLSEMALFLVRLCDEEAENTHLDSIDQPTCARLLAGYSFVVPSPTTEYWTATDLAQKPRLLADVPAAPFVDCTTASGLPLGSAVERLTPTSFGPGTDSMTLVAFTGAGIAVGDIDGDGLPDVFLPGEGGNRLYKNLGHRRFRDITTESGITDTRLDDAHQAIFVDYDNDGRLDLFIVHSQSPSRLFHQRPDGRFEDVTATCGIITGPGAHDATWLDYDNDGLLDCYVGHYGTGRPTLDGLNGPGNRLFHNLGGGRFEDVTARSGTGTTGWTLATVALDYDRDGWPDLFVANDFGRSELLRNQHDGTFRRVGRAAGVDVRGSSMNASVVDLDGSGWPGLFITQIDMFSKSIGFIFPQDKTVLNLNERILRSTFSIAGNKLYRNRQDGTFESVDERVFEPGDWGWGWSATFFDYDNDGSDDCYLTNGWIDGTPAARQHHPFFLARGHRLYAWSGGGDQGYASNGRGCVAADFTGTGQMDLLVNDFNQGVHLLANANRTGHHWLKVRLQGVRANRQGIGAAVAVVRQDGSRQWRFLTCGANYLSQEDTTLHFGLGAATTARGLEVRWPGGQLQEVPGPWRADTVVTVVQATTP